MLEEKANQQPKIKGSLLDFHEEIVRQFEDENGLCILAAGLGLHKIVAALLARHAVESEGPVLILGASERQRSQTIVEFCCHCSNLRTPMVITNEVPANERHVIYQSNASAFVTTRIAVVDLLTARLDPKLLSGIIICNAHKVTEPSGEGFAAYLFRESNSKGFIRALTDRPTHFGFGFNSVEHVMKSLGLRRLFLYPRFQSNVRACLEKHAAEVIELEQDMSPAMELIQDSLIQMIEGCIKELNKTNRIDCTNLTRDRALSKSFDEIVRRQLDPVWNTVSRKTKQLVYDLRTLRQLADFSLRLDP
eukprot:CAMPEP_0177594056 /NCGR_PEP_ID=MMETSP0419_2-20121207/9555_1 /TAXON_ID=582737 /ORGANISM="Tetraselmis sp., Strain GSL018" /LENGTH=305 /DNA_ID=CAMNT_0019085295 /DNA_START=103 /DNA_END=1017 /DNA_ORIENTATION=-